MMGFRWNPHNSRFQRPLPAHQSRTRAANTKHLTLLGFCIRCRGSDGRGHRGLLRGGGLAVSGFVRAAAGD